VLLWALVLSVCSYSYSNAQEVNPTTSGVNEYGVDCTLTPWMSSCGDDWRNQPGMTEHNISDDGNVQVPIPFSFPYNDSNGTIFTHSWMYSNGVVGFMSPTHSFCCNGEDVASGNYTGLPYFSYSIAALWTDLLDMNVDVDGDGIDDTGFFTHEVDTNNDGQIDTLRYLWRNIQEFANRDTANTFGAQIDSAGGIEIHHFDIDVRNHAVTVGIFGDVSLPDGAGIQQFEYYGYNDGGVTQEGHRIYTFNMGEACQANPLISPQCPGYEEAYATVVYDQSCAADPLYDIGCLGYEEAYFNQQCSADPLYDMSCNGYADAIYVQQCTANPLYDVGCDGYETAYYDNQCSLDPLYDGGCPGYSTAYYNQQCSIDPLYDLGCPGYDTAYYNQQCSISALYDSGCPGYDTAYYDQQCSLDVLYDSGCNGYADAFYSLQCSLDTLYDTQCPGYAEAYYTQQCTANPLYDTQCPGYETAYIESQCERDPLYSPTCSGYAAAMAELETSNPEQTTEVYSSEVFVEEASSTGDALVDDVIRTEETVSVAPTGGFSVLAVPSFEDPVTTAQVEAPAVETIEVTEAPQQDEQQTEDIIMAELDVAEEQVEEPVEQETSNEQESDREEQSSGDVDQPVESSGDEESDASGNEDSDTEATDDSGGSSESREQARPTREQKRESRRAKIAEIAKQKAMQLANRMSEAASFEAQQAVQQSILAFINYNPGFLDYKNMGIQELDFYTQEQMPDGEIDKNARGLRNGLAQQILHEKMVDMQYER